MGTFFKAGTEVIGKTEVIDKVSTREEGEDLGYDQYMPILQGGTYETVAKSILSYLQAYDECINK